jgi:hypothetical protein
MARSLLRLQRMVHKVQGATVAGSFAACDVFVVIEELHAFEVEIFQHGDFGM